MTYLRYLEEVQIIPKKITPLKFVRYNLHLIDLFLLAPMSSDEFQAVEGESEERRRARLERHQRTRERAVMLI